MSDKTLITSIIVVFSISVMGWVFYPDEKPRQPETMPLIPMMQQLLIDMHQVDRGIYTEEFELIEQGAGRISDHPTMISQEKKLVKKTLGAEMKQFVEFDMVVHHHADSMRVAAIEEDMKNILRHYRIVQQGCVDCHSNYREPISSARRDE